MEDPDLIAPEFLDADFWEDCSVWPPDSPGYVFLARAVDEIGQLMYRSGWTEVVTKTPEPDLPPPGSPRSVAQQFLRDEEKVTEEQTREEAKRWTRVIRSIANSCKKGTLVTAAQHKSMGDWIDLATSFWRTKNSEAHFFHCDASVVAASGFLNDKRNYWIYVERKSLDTYLGALSVRPRRGRPRGGGSMAEVDEPFIQEMVRLLRSGAAENPTSAAVEVAEHAPGNSPKSTQTRLRKRFVQRFPNWKQELCSRNS
jgi:hypothetical protein